MAGPPTPHLVLLGFSAKNMWWSKAVPVVVEDRSITERVMDVLQAAPATIISFIDENASRMVYAFLIAMATGVILDMIRRLFFLKRTSFSGKHVLITGGSQGIGKATAEIMLSRGARVTLLARTEATLKKAAAEMREAEERRRSKKGAHATAVQVQYVSASITDETALTSAVARATDAFGPVDCLVACAGGAAPGLFLHTSVDEYARSMELNYVGTLRAIKAVVPSMVERKSGQIVIIGSALSVVAFMGYSTYAPAKHALRGLADTLRNELVGFGVTVHFAYPPDTATPGFEHENQSKPIETASMVPVDVFPAEQVADQLVGGVEAGLYHLPSPDLVINWMVSSRAGVSPRAYPFVESALLPLASLIEAAASLYFDMWGRRYARRHAREQKALGK